MKVTKTNEEMVLEARLKRLSKPKEVLAKQPRMMGQFVEIYAKQREAKG